MLMDNEEPVKKTKSSVKVLLFLLLLVGGLITLVIFSRNPGQGGPFIILAFLFLVFLFVFLLSLIIVRAVGLRTKNGSFSRVRILYVSVAVAAGAVFLVGLQTLRQLQLIDLILVLIFEILLNFYLLRRF